MKSDIWQTNNAHSSEFKGRKHLSFNHRLRKNTQLVQWRDTSEPDAMKKATYNQLHLKYKASFEGLFYAQKTKSPSLADELFAEYSFYCY